MCEVARPARSDLIGLAVAVTLAVVALVLVLTGVIYLLFLPFAEWLT